MFENGQYRFNISLTQEPYFEKPPKADYNKINFERKEMCVDDLVGAVEAGYGFTYIYNQRNFHISYKTKENFRYTKVLAFDIDDTDCDFDCAIDSCIYPPTFAYRTYSDGEYGKCSYRFVYVFSDYINSQNFSQIYHTVSTVNHFKNLDVRQYNQFYWGTNKPDSFVSNNIYTLADFNVERTTYKTHTDLIPSADGTYYTFPEEYYEVKRLWHFDKDSKRRHIVKYTDEGKLSRRKQLFIDGQLLKKINDINNADTMYNILQNELKLYYDNTTDCISQEELKDIALRVLRYPFKCKTQTNHPGFRINVEYWKSVMNVGNKVYKPIVAINHIRKKIQLEKFKELYNKDLSCKENMKVMKENNFKISRMTFYRYKEECNSQNI